MLPPRQGPLAPGTLIDQKYAIVRVLGEGGMGIVYLARDIHTGLDVVVKAIRSELAHRDDVRQRTLAEGRALAQIDHPNVVHLKAVVVDAANLWLVMQYIDGESLEKTIARYTERGERMPVDEALSIFRQIASGVGAAHEEGVIHRDLKPANVLLRKKDHTAKVTDFGIAKVAADTSREVTKGIIGSLWYMSPEQVTGRRDLDQRVDIYALGILLYQMLVGRVPFDAESDYDIMKLHAEAPMPRVAAERPDVPAALDALIQKACAKDRGQRFQTCAELIVALDRIVLAARPSVTLPDGGPALRPAAGGSNRPVDASAGLTGQGTELPAARSRAGGKWLVAGIIVVGTGCIAGALLGYGVLPSPATAPSHPAPAGSASHVVPRPTPVAPHPTTVVSPATVVPSTTVVSPTTVISPRAALSALVGTWATTGKELDAVLVDDILEFRVRTPAQFAPQDYEAGEARFALRPTPDPGVFLVEDRIRPIPRPGKTFDPRSRGACQEVWKSAGGEPLRARYDGTRLSVEFAKIEPTDGNFVLEGSRITSCRGLRDLPAARVVSTLSRP